VFRLHSEKQLFGMNSLWQSNSPLQASCEQMMKKFKSLRLQRKLHNNDLKVTVMSVPAKAKLTQEG
jgi:hypothetical protein